MNDIVFHDDGNNDLPGGIGLRKKVAGTMAEADFKKKVMVRTPYAMTDFEDHKKQKKWWWWLYFLQGSCITKQILTFQLASSTQDELIIEIIWPHNMRDVTTLLSWFMMSWH